MRRDKYYERKMSEEYKDVEFRKDGRVQFTRTTKENELEQVIIPKYLMIE